MEIFRRAANPWGQEVLLGIGWGLMWAAIIAGVAFLAVHALLAARTRAAGATPGPAPADIPGRIVRHGIGARLFHWSMTIAMFALLITAFGPVMGWQFDWVTIHWIAGLALTATVVYHIIHALARRGLGRVWVSASDVRDGLQEVSQFVGGGAPPERKPGKYPVAQKLYHHVAGLAALATIATGLVMMKRIDTPVLRQDPYLLGDAAWGWVYVVHGLAGVGLITLVIAHVYFAVRPEKRWLTRSMFKGWITSEEYLANHDPERWKLGPGDAATEAAAVRAPPSVSPSA